MQKHILEPDFWIDKYSDMLLNYAVVRVRDREKAKDLVQDTFVTALKTIDTFRGEVSEKNWLYLILKTRILDFYKKKKELLASDLSREEENGDFFSEKGHWLEQRQPNEWTTDRMVQSKEFMTVLEACKENLTPSQSLVFTMKYLDGEESETICKELNITASNYWVIVHRAKLQLRDCLENNWMK